MSSRSLCLLLLLLPAWGHSSTITLMGVPEYQWFHGCSPTAGGMLFGYWDSKPGYGNLFDGDASTWWGNDDGSTGTKRMVASQEFITGTSHPLNCIADFMGTDSAGGSFSQDIFAGMRRYAYWDDPVTSIDESYTFFSNHHLVYNQNTMGAQDALSTFGFNLLMREIDAGRPMILNLSLDDGKGHSVVAYGYQDNGPGDQWFACRDTWLDGNSDGVKGVSAKVEGGTEWWKWQEAPAGMNFGEAYFLEEAVYFGPQNDGWVYEVAEHDAFGSAQQVLSTTTIFGSIGARNEEDWYALWMSAHDIVAASTSDDLFGTDGLDSYLELYDPIGTPRIAQDDVFASRKSHFSYRADVEGWWRIRVTGVYGTSTGDYYLNLNTYQNDIPEPGTLGLLGFGLIAVGLFLRGRSERRDPSKVCPPRDHRVSC